MFLLAATLIGGTTNRYIIESIRMRNENVELLHDLIEQKDELDMLIVIDIARLMSVEEERQLEAA